MKMAELTPLKMFLKTGKPVVGGWIYILFNSISVGGFTSFLTVFQSHQENGREIMKGCMQQNPIYD